MTIPHKVLTVYPQIKNIFSKVNCLFSSVDGLISTGDCFVHEAAIKVKAVSANKNIFFISDFLTCLKSFLYLFLFSYPTVN